MKNLKKGTELYHSLLDEFDYNFQKSSPSFSNLLWQLIINEAWKDNGVHCFAPVYDQNGLVLGIVELGISGYYNTHVYFTKEINFEIANVLINHLNKQMFGFSKIDTTKIVLSSMVNDIKANSTI